MGFSVSPDGENFIIPGEQNYINELKMELGSAGTALARMGSSLMDKRISRPGKFVSGMQSPGPCSFWKIFSFNHGTNPIKAEGPIIGHRNIVGCHLLSALIVIFTKKR